MTIIDLHTYIQRVEQERANLLRRLAYLDGQAAILREILADVQEITDDTTIASPDATGGADDASESGG